MIVMMMIVMMMIVMMMIVMMMMRILRGVAGAGADPPAGAWCRPPEMDDRAQLSWPDYHTLTMLARLSHNHALTNARPTISS